MNKAKIISLSNQKGGVGKTSLTVHLSGVMAEKNLRVLLIDLDPQGNLSSFFLENIYDIETTAREMILEGLEAKEVLQKTRFENIDVIPANITLSDLDAKLAGVDDAQYILMDCIRGVVDQYDFILIDCPPSLARATKMALVASTHLIVPIECQEWAVKGAAQLLTFVDSVKLRANPVLQLLGFVINKYNNRRRIELEFNGILRDNFNNRVFDTELRNVVVYTEAVTSRQPINYYAPQSNEALSFRNLLGEILNRV